MFIIVMRLKLFLTSKDDILVEKDLSYDTEITIICSCDSVSNRVRDSYSFPTGWSSRVCTNEDYPGHST